MQTLRIRRSCDHHIMSADEIGGLEVVRVKYEGFAIPARIVKVTTDNVQFKQRRRRFHSLLYLCRKRSVASSTS
jgi:hypothetical protein